MLSCSIPDLSVEIISVSSFGETDYTTVSSTMGRVFSPGDSNDHLQTSGGNPALIPQFSKSVAIVSGFTAKLLTEAPGVRTYSDYFTFSKGQTSSVAEDNSTPLRTVKDKGQVASLAVV